MPRGWRHSARSIRGAMRDPSRRSRDWICIVREKGARSRAFTLECLEARIPAKESGLFVFGFCLVFDHRTANGGLAFPWSAARCSHRDSVFHKSERTCTRRRRKAGPRTSERSPVVPDAARPWSIAGFDSPVRLKHLIAGVLEHTVGRLLRRRATGMCAADASTSCSESVGGNPLRVRAQPQ
jgi:hypothetical protein